MFQDFVQDFKVFGFDIVRTLDPLRFAILYLLQGNLRIGEMV